MVCGKSTRRKALNTPTREAAHICDRKVRSIFLSSSSRLYRGGHRTANPRVSCRGDIGRGRGPTEKERRNGGRLIGCHFPFSLCAVPVRTGPPEARLCAVSGLQNCSFRMMSSSLRCPVEIISTGTPSVFSILLIYFCAFFGSFENLRTPVVVSFHPFISS